MPLVRRIPKRGFTNKFKKEWNIINIGTLQKIKSLKEGAEVDREFLMTNKVLRKKRLPVKVLGKVKITKAITVKADSFSKSAKKAIEGAGGKAEVVSSPAAAAKTKD